MDFLKLNREVIKGAAEGKVIWQPRILCWYDDRVFKYGKLTGKYDSMTPSELYRELGCSNRCYDYNGCVEAYDKVPVERIYERVSELEMKITIRTPVGSVYEVIRSNTSNSGQFQSKWLAETAEDVNVLIWLENNTLWRWNQARWDEAAKIWGNLGLPSIYVPRVTIQKPFIETMGVENTIYTLSDYPEIMEEYFEAIENNVMRMIKVINESPLEWVNFGDNIHGGIISPELFERYVLPAYIKRNKELHKAGKFTFAHWDGDCKPILKYAKSCGLDGIEAITPKPQGDVTVEEIKEALGDEIFLIDGIPAVLFDDIYPEEMLINTTNKIMDLFAPKLILGISDEMSSTGNIERVKLVGKLVDEFNKNKIINMEDK